jgi:hypothetical protein
MIKFCIIHVIISVHSAVTIEMTVYWGMIPFSFVNMYQRFGVFCCLLLQVRGVNCAGRKVQWYREAEGLRPRANQWEWCKINWILWS